MGMTPAMAQSIIAAPVAAPLRKKKRTKAVLSRSLPLTFDIILVPRISPPSFFSVQPPRPSRQHPSTCPRAVPLACLGCTLLRDFHSIPARFFRRMRTSAATRAQASRFVFDPRAVVRTLLSNRPAPALGKVGENNSRWTRRLLRALLLAPPTVGDNNVGR